jgi:hypothetical protein
MFRDPQGRWMLSGDGSYKFQAAVDGKDLVVQNVKATWFGGDDDPEDDGSTASGVRTKGNPALLGCALPMSGCHCVYTEGSPLPKIPWRTLVQVFSRETGRMLRIPVIDIGPSKHARSLAAIDLTQAAFAALGGSKSRGHINVDYRVLGGVDCLPAQVKAQLK